MIKTFDEFVNEGVVRIGGEEKKLNEWFNTLPFYTMEKMLKVNQSDFKPDDGYIEFVDYCEEQWNNLSIEEKQELYNEYNG
jgi:hypothetical protein